MVLVLSCVWVFVTAWTAARQASLSMGFPRQECWSGLSFLPHMVPYPQVWVVIFCPPQLPCDLGHAIPLNLNFFICLTGLYYPACKGKCHQRGQKCVLSVHTRYFMKNRSSRSFLFVCWRIKFRVHISITSFPTPHLGFPTCWPASTVWLYFIHSVCLYCSCSPLLSFSNLILKESTK